MCRIERGRELVRNSGRIVIFTGAGISTGSGIADFRSPGGVWSRYKTVTIQEFLSDPEKRFYYWKYKAETIPAMLKALPNAAHWAVKRLQDDGRLLGLITQNIDGLHEKTGIIPEKTVRLHGTNLEAVCLSCRKIFPILPQVEIVVKEDQVPTCPDCSGWLKPNTISFGQALDPEELRRADEFVRGSDLTVAIGSSLTVYPAAGFVELAAILEIPIIICNRDPTPLDSLASVIFRDDLTGILPELFR